MKLPITVEGGSPDRKPVVVAQNASNGATSHGVSLDAATPEGAAVTTVLFPTTLKLLSKGCWNVKISYGDHVLDFNVRY